MHIVCNTDPRNSSLQLYTTLVTFSESLVFVSCSLRLSFPFRLSLGFGFGFWARRICFTSGAFAIGRCLDCNLLLGRRVDDGPLHGYPFRVLYVGIGAPANTRVVLVLKRVGL